MATTKTLTKTRRYFMALFDKRRTPIRVAAAKESDALKTCREWWVVMAPSAESARKLCLQWPTKVMDAGATITNHGKRRT